MDARIHGLKFVANTIRHDIIRMLAEARSGHTAGPLGLADIFAALYFDYLNVDPKNPDSVNRDYLVLSNGHVCPVLYSALANRGFFDKDELFSLRKLGSRLQGHPHRSALPGIETSSGPLGSGLSQAAGMALVFLRENKSNRVVCVTSDGEHQEGNHWEAVLFASKYKLSNLLVIVDRNRIQIDGLTEDIMPLKSLKEKYLSFGWGVIEINGNSMSEIIHALDSSKKHINHPVVLIANIIPGKGVSFIENNYKWHGKTPSLEEAERALFELKHKRVA
ncbi:MAG: transketolase [Candidatus Woesearchaeota archaeon]